MRRRTSFAGGEDEGYFVIRKSQVRLLPWLRSCSSAVEHRKLLSSPNSPANVKKGATKMARLNTLNLNFGPRTHEGAARSEEHTSELQSHSDLVCRLLLEKKNT